MDNNSEKNHKDSVSQLEEENRGLRTQLKKLQMQEEEFQTYRLY